MKSFWSRRSSLWRLVVLCAVFHLALVCSLYVAGRFNLFPGVIDAGGMMTASDSYIYRTETVMLADILRDEGITAWARAPYPLHLKLYSLSFAPLQKFFGTSVLSAEPVNLFLYLTIVVLVYALGREVFDQSSGLLAASMVAVWPTFLLHTTQLFRDPLFVALVLLLVGALLLWLTRNFSIKTGALVGVAGALALSLLWLVRVRMWPLFVAVVLCGAACFVARQIRERRALKGNLAGVASLLVAVFFVPTIVGKLQEPDMSLPAPYIENGVVQRRTVSVEASEAREASKAGEPVLLWRIVPLIKLSRQGFIDYSGGGTNIDADVEFNSTRDLLSYLPRAMIIGLFAPFPDAWFAEGRMLGRAGRALVGLETLCAYTAFALSLFALWQRRRDFSVWFLLFVVIISATAFGLVVVNLGALYRLRYAFWMLLVVLGAGGARAIMSALVSHRSPILEETVSLT